MSYFPRQTRGKILQLKDLAWRLDDFYRDFDFYGWSDSHSDQAAVISNTVHQLANGEKDAILEWLNDSLSMLEPDEKALRQRIERLQDEVKAA